jgi:hypothetical protein
MNWGNSVFAMDMFFCFDDGSVEDMLRCPKIFALNMGGQQGVSWKKMYIFCSNSGLKTDNHFDQVLQTLTTSNFFFNEESLFFHSSC